MVTCVIDQMHIVHARRASGHTGQAGQTTIDVLHYPVARGPIAFEHVLDQVDASARAIKFVTQQNERRASCDTEAAMDAVPQYFFGLGDIGVRQLGEEKFVCIDQTPSYMRPGLRIPLGSKASLIFRVKRATGTGSG